MGASFPAKEGPYRPFGALPSPWLLCWQCPAARSQGGSLYQVLLGGRASSWSALIRLGWFCLQA